MQAGRATLLRMRVDLSALLGRGRGDAIAVAGVRVGEAAAGIERSALTGADADVPGAPRSFASELSSRRGPDGTPVEIPLADRIDAVLQDGGWLWCSEIAMHVVRGRIARIVVRGPSLASLHIARELDIEGRFGPAAGREWQLGCRHHHYPDRRLVIAWHRRNERVEHVALGPDPWCEPGMGARELLSELLDVFEALRRVDWSEPPEVWAQVRHQRVAALARALELGTVPDLVHGRFLDGELDEGREEVLADIAARGIGADTPERPLAAALFAHLLDYRVDVERVMRAPLGWLMCSDPALLGMMAIQGQIAAQLAAMMVDIDRWLCTLMDPAQRRFALGELIARHGWPDDDRLELAMEEM